MSRYHLIVKEHRDRIVSLIETAEAAERDSQSQPAPSHLSDVYMGLMNAVRFDEHGGDLFRELHCAWNRFVTHTVSHPGDIEVQPIAGLSAFLREFLDAQKLAERTRLMVMAEALQIEAFALTNAEIMERCQVQIRIDELFSTMFGSAAK